MERVSRGHATPFGTLLRELRTGRGLRLSDLGKPATIHHYETGRNLPRDRRAVVRVADALNVDPGILLEALGWPHRPLSQDVQSVLKMTGDDPESAVRAAHRGIEHAIDSGRLEELWQWQEALRKAMSTMSGGPLPLDAHGRTDIDAWRNRATQLIMEDAWYTAAIILDTLITFVPFNHPSYGKIAYNLGIALARLGRYPEADTASRQAWRWASQHQDQWMVVVICGAILHDAVADRAEVPADALKVIDQYDGDPVTRAYAATWRDDALAHQAARQGDWRTAERHALSMRRRFDKMPALVDEALRVADTEAVVALARGDYASALGTIDSELTRAIDQGVPGYILLDSLLLSAECAWRQEDPSAPARIAWLEGWLGGLKASLQLQGLAMRLGSSGPSLLAGNASAAYYRTFWRGASRGRDDGPLVLNVDSG